MAYGLKSYLEHTAIASLLVLTFYWGSSLSYVYWW